MNHSYKAAFFWLVIALCFVMHGYFELSEIKFGIDVTTKNSTGKVPVSLHVIRIILEIGSLFLAVLSVQLSAHWFRWSTFIWAAILVPVNAFHLGTTLLHHFTDYTQITLLSLILYVNVLLVLELKIGKSAG